jgi:hypothetical protein
MGFDKERYHIDKLYHDHVVGLVRKYQSTDRGKAVVAQCKERFKIENPDYFSSYMSEKRKIAKKNKICITCFKKKSVKNYSSCRACLDKNKKTKGDE